MAITKIGRIVSSGEGRILWIIDRYLMYNVLFGPLRSPCFTFSGTSYFLECGLTKSRNMNIDFCKNGPSSVRKLNVKLGIETENKTEIEGYSGETYVEGDFEPFVWTLRSELLFGREDITPAGRLTLFCELRLLDGEEEPQKSEICEGAAAKVGDSDANEDQAILDGKSEEAVAKVGGSDSNEDKAILDGKILKKTRSDFKSLLDSGEDCDVTIKVQGQEFLAHRIILRARSPVFKSMFSHETAEEQSGVVAIEDCDPGTFPDFLNYLYTGSTEHVCEGNVCQLYADADKYGVEELKEWCAVFMKSNLSVGKFCDIMAVALLHSEADLIESATEFFCTNAREITQTASWQTFLHENTTVGNELFVKFISRI